MLQGKLLGEEPVRMSLVYYQLSKNKSCFKKQSKLSLSIKIQLKHFDSPCTYYISKSTISNIIGNFTSVALVERRRPLVFKTVAGERYNCYTIRQH